MKVFFSLSLFFAFAMTSFAGTLSGTVKAQPKPELAEAPAGGAKYDSRQFKFVEKIKYDQIKLLSCHVIRPLVARRLLSG